MTMPNWFRWGDEAEGESQTDAVYGGSTPQSIEPVSSDPGFSWSDYGEAVVKRLTSYDVYEMLFRDPPEEDYSSPNVYTRGKAQINKTVSDTTSAIKGTFARYALLIVAVLLILAVAYGTTLYAIQKKVF